MQLPDFHTHSTASDGVLTPRELIKHAAAQNITTLALTDHDTLTGLPEAILAAQEFKVKLITGIELSVTWGGRTIHIIGLDFSLDYQELQLEMAKIATKRAERAREIGNQLAKHGFPNAYEGALALTHGVSIGRTHFARFLIAQGMGTSTNDIFRRYLTRGKPGYVPSVWASLETALHWIHAAGGIAVIAHPARYDFAAKQLKKLFNEFRELGGIALEVISGSHSPADILNCANYSKDYQLLASMGSDYHEPGHPWFGMGNLPQLPTNCTPIWHARADFIA